MSTECLKVRTIAIEVAVQLDELDHAGIVVADLRDLCAQPRQQQLQAKGAHLEVALAMQQGHPHGVAHIGNSGVQAAVGRGLQYQEWR